MVKYCLEKPTETGMTHLFLVLPHVAELRKTEAFGQGEMSSATDVETLVMGALKKKMNLFPASDVVAVLERAWRGPGPIVLKEQEDNTLGDVCAHQGRVIG